jgi:hypothetical protein
MAQKVAVIILAFDFHFDSSLRGQVVISTTFGALIYNYDRQRKNNETLSINSTIITILCQIQSLVHK